MKNEDAERLKEKLKRFGTYLERRGFEVNVKITKIISFGMTGGMRNGAKIEMKGKVLGRVRKMRYLRYEMRENNQKVIT